MYVITTHEQPVLFVAAPTYCALPRCSRTRRHYSHGTADCIRRAKAAGIPVHAIPA